MQHHFSSSNRTWSAVSLHTIDRTQCHNSCIWSSTLCQAWASQGAGTLVINKGNNHIKQVESYRMVCRLLFCILFFLHFFHSTTQEYLEGRGWPQITRPVEINLKQWRSAWRTTGGSQTQYLQGGAGRRGMGGARWVRVMRKSVCKPIEWESWGVWSWRCMDRTCHEALETLVEMNIHW